MHGMTTYEIMHGENLIATITLQGQCRILEPSFMPWNLYLEETDELDGRVNNVTNFYYWCATRVLTLDRKYAIICASLKSVFDALATITLNFIVFITIT